MANVLAPFGFMPVRRLDGSSWTSNMSVRKIAAADTNKIYKGDLVKSLNTGYIRVAGASDTQVNGVFVGCKYLSTSMSRTVWSPRWPGADSAYDAEAYVIDDPWCVFLAQTGGVSGAAAGLTLINTNVQIAVTTAGNDLTGISGQVVNENTAADTATFPLRVVDVPGVQVANLGASVNGYDTATKYNVVLVTFNNQDFKSLTGI